MEDDHDDEPLEPFGPWEDGKVLAEAADIAKQTVENFARVGLQFTIPEGDPSFEGLDAKQAQEKAMRELVARIVGFGSAEELKRLVLGLEEEIFKVADPPTREPNKPMPDFDDENEDLPGALRVVAVLCCSQFSPPSRCGFSLMVDAVRALGPTTCADVWPPALRACLREHRAPQVRLARHPRGPLLQVHRPRREPPEARQAQDRRDASRGGP